MSQETRKKEGILFLTPVFITEICRTSLAFFDIFCGGGTPSPVKHFLIQQKLTHTYE